MFGCTFILVTIVLLVIYIYGRHKRLSAQAELKKLYQEKRMVTQTIADIENKYRLQKGSYTTIAPLISKMRIDK